MRKSFSVTTDVKCNIKTILSKSRGTTYKVFIFYGSISNINIGTSEKHITLEKLNVLHFARKRIYQIENDMCV